MERKRIKLEVWVDLDPIPGSFHSKESARNIVGMLLGTQLAAYNPTVSTTTEDAEDA